MVEGESVQGSWPRVVRVASEKIPPPHFERKDDKRLREHRAKNICKTCGVRRDCLEYALRIREQHGIWGGMNETERIALLPEKTSNLV